MDRHTAFNEPVTSLISRTGVRALTEDTLIVKSRFFDNDPNKGTKTALSVGVGTVCHPKQALLVISDHNRAISLDRCVEGGVDHAWISQPCGYIPTASSPATKMPAVS